MGRLLFVLVALGVLLPAGDAQARSRRRRPPPPKAAPAPAAAPVEEAPAPPGPPSPGGLGAPPPRAAAPVDLLKGPCTTRVQQRLTRRQAAARKAEGEAPRLLAERRFPQLIRLLTLAYAREPRPKLLYDLARAFHEAEQDAEALLLYGRYLQGAPDGAHRKDAEGYVAGIRVKLGAEADRADAVVQGYVDAGGRHARTDYDKSIDAFTTTYALTGIAQALFNLGQGHRRAGRAEEAYHFYGRFLAEDPQTPLRRETEGYLDLLGRGLCTDPPVWKRPWLWAVVGAAVAVGVGVTLGVTLSQRGPRADVGPFDVHF